MITLTQTELKWIQLTLNNAINERKECMKVQPGMEEMYDLIIANYEHVAHKISEARKTGAKRIAISRY